jgi:hypothetical protein
LPADACLQLHDPSGDRVTSFASRRGRRCARLVRAAAAGTRRRAW